MKIAMYRSLSMNFDRACEVTFTRERNPDDVRVSEILDVEFIPLTNESIVAKEVEYLDVVIDEANEKKAVLSALYTEDH
jgi:hypothetical protein